MLGLTKYYALAGKRIAMRNGYGPVTYLHQDHLGSTLATRNTGASESARYYPYGATQTGSVGTVYKYSGQRTDSGIGLAWVNSRWYDSYLSRWIQPDTIVPDLVNPQNLNRYSYVLNNPLRYTDPSGHCPQCAIAAAAAPFGPPGWVVGGVAALAVTASAGGQMFVWGPNAEGNREAVSDAWNGLVDSVKTRAGSGTDRGSSQNSGTGGPGRFDPNDPLKAFRDAGIGGAGLRAVQEALQNPDFDPNKALRALQQYQDKGIQVWGHALEQAQELKGNITTQDIINVYNQTKGYGTAVFQDTEQGRMVIWSSVKNLAVIVDQATGAIVTVYDRAKPQSGWQPLP